MAKKIVVKGDKVSGTDTHGVQGPGTTQGGQSATFTGTASYSYDGSITDDLSDFVTVAGVPVALVTSGSTLTAGSHTPSSGTSFTPATPITPIPASLQFTGTVGKGKPGQGAGSTFVEVGGAPVLLDGDKLDTCGSEPGTGNSSVAASEQDFVQVSE
jgi:hypothetical protein